MSDKELIKQEIERRYNCEKCYPLDREANVAAAVLQELLLFIDSLPEEPVSEGLEEAANFYANTHIEWFDSEGNPCVMPAFKAGAEWQKHQMKEALQTEYEKGRFDAMQDFIEKDEQYKTAYVVTRSEEHCDYVEKVFFDKEKAEEYCKPFNEDENSYHRDITEIEVSL